MGILLSRSGSGIGSSDWNDLQNKPSILTDDQINWGEIQNKPTIESGTFTPKLTDTTNFDYTHSIQEGFYLKVDNILFLNLKIAVPNAYRNIAAFMQVTDLPFTFDGENKLEGTLYNITFGAIPVFLSIDATNTIKIMYVQTSASSALNSVSTSHLRSGSNPLVIYISGLAKIS